MRAKRNLIGSVVFMLLGAGIAPAVGTTSAPEARQVDLASREGRSVIIQGASGAAVRAAVEAHQGTVTQDLWIVNGVAADVPRSELAALAAEPGVTHVTEDVAVSMHDATPSPSLVTSGRSVVSLRAPGSEIDDA